MSIGEKSNASTLLEAITQALPGAPLAERMRILNEVRDFLAQKFLLFTASDDAAEADCASYLWDYIMAGTPPPRLAKKEEPL